MRTAVALVVILISLLCACSTQDPDSDRSTKATTPVATTEVRTISPFGSDRDGMLVEGYTTHDVATLAPLKCFTDISGGYRCSDTPEGLRFCWQAAENTAACLADPRDRELGTMGATFVMMSDVSPYIPAGLDLADGSRCTLGRNPMAVATGDVRYVHVYGCTGGPTKGIYTEPLPGIGNPVRDVVDTSTALWTVQGGDESAPTGPVGVVVAYQLTTG